LSMIENDLLFQRWKAEAESAQKLLRD